MNRRSRYACDKQQLLLPLLKYFECIHAILDLSTKPLGSTVVKPFQSFYQAIRQHGGQALSVVPIDPLSKAFSSSMSHHNLASFIQYQKCTYLRCTSGINHVHITQIPMSYEKLAALQQIMYSSQPKYSNYEGTTKWRISSAHLNVKNMHGWPSRDPLWITFKGPT